MKKTFSLFFALLFCIVSFSQKVERITVKSVELLSFYDKTEYKYPAFTRASIYFTNGESARGRLNFNYFDQTMRYINERGDTLSIANEDVSLISFGVDSFFYDNGFYEWAATSSKVRLAEKHIYKLLERKPIGAFETSSPAKHIERVDWILGVTKYDLNPNEELVFSRETTYYISPIKELKNNFVVANKKNLNALFPKLDVDDFIKEHKLNLNKEEDLVDVFIYVSKPK